MLKNRGDADSSAIAYRPDIDGLRAVAVVSVVAYHITPAWLRGGYLGVDIFFVISGYLITSIVWREIESDGFSIGRFYVRRIRRIIPALFFLLAVTSAFAFLFLLPTDLIGYGKGQLATLGFVANIFFWRDTDYFSRAAETKPLLHLWSLGVEEQFYLLFPTFLFVVARWWRAGTAFCVVALTAGSFAVGCMLLYVGGVLPAFYLLPARTWELGLGALVAVFRRELPKTLAASVSAFGALLVLSALVVPLDWIALLPAPTLVTIGTAAMIVAGASMPLSNRLLALQPVAFVGLISYSLYLWHWPIIVFARYYLVRDFTAAETVLAVFGMAAIATLSWRYVEQPFRSRTIPTGTVLLAAGAGLVLLAVIAFGAIALRGLPQRLSQEAARLNEAVDTNYRCPIEDYVFVGSARACFMNLPSHDPDDARFVLIGNSHAQMYAPAWIHVLAARRISGLLMPENGCLPVLSVNIQSGCFDLARRNLESMLQLHNVTTVAIGLTWKNALVDAAGKKIDNQVVTVLQGAIDQLIDRIRATGKDVILLGPNPEPGYDIAAVLSRKIAFGRPSADDTRSEAVADFERYFESSVRHFAHRGDIAFVRTDLVQLRHGRYQYLLDGYSLFSDDNHISAGEVWRYEPMFGTVLDQLTHAKASPRRR